MSKKTRADILEARSEAMNKRDAILQKAQEEKRALTQKELQEVQSLATEVVRCDAELDKLNVQEPKPVQEPRKDSNIMQVIREAISGNFSEESRALMQEGAELNRRAGLTTESGAIVVPFKRDLFSVKADGNNLVQVDKKQILDPLYNAMVLSEAGATYLTDLVGNIEIPNYSGTSCAWAEENATSQDGRGTFGSVKLSPKRLTTTLTISKQLIIQDSVGAYNMLMRTIYDTIANKLEATILGNGAGSATQPAGLFNGTINNKGAISFKRLVDMEAELEKNGIKGNNLAYITNPAGRAILRSSLKDKTTGAGDFLTDGGSINGIKLLSTANVADKLNTDENGLLLGDFSNLIIGQWGGLDLVVDPYTKKREGAIELTINAYFDAVVQRAGSIVSASFKA